MKTMIRLFYNPLIYTRIMSEPLTKAVLRYLIGMFLLALVSAAYLTITFYPTFTHTINQFSTHIQTSLPDDAEIKLQQSQLSTHNLPIPYTFTPADGSTIYLLDPTADATALATSAAIISFGQTHVKIQSDTGTHTLINYQEENWPDFSLTGSAIKTSLTALQSGLTQFRLLIPLLISLPLWIALTLSNLINLVIFTLFIQLINSAFICRISLKTMAKITLSTIIVAQSLTLIILALYQKEYPLFFPTAYIAITLLVLKIISSPTNITTTTTEVS
jgi:hypothetical protein